MKGFKFRLQSVLDARQKKLEDCQLGFAKAQNKLHCENLVMANIVKALDATLSIVKKENITQIYLLAALLSATGEKNPKLAWDINMQSMLQILDISLQEKLDRVYWPSSIAVFGTSTPKEQTQQKTIIEQAEKELEEKNQLMLEALKAKKVMEKLKEKAIDEFKENINRHEMLLIDEIATGRYTKQG